MTRQWEVAFKNQYHPNAEAAEFTMGVYGGKVLKFVRGSALTEDRDLAAFVQEHMGTHFVVRKPTARSNILHTFPAESHFPCAKCGSICRPGQKFCSQCGHNLAQPLVGEKPLSKVVLEGEEGGVSAASVVDDMVDKALELPPYPVVKPSPLPQAPPQEEDDSAKYGDTKYGEPVVDEVQDVPSKVKTLLKKAKKIRKG